MGGLSIWHWVIVALVILVLFGRGKISEMMGDFGKGVSSFKKGLAETEDAVKPAAQIPPPPAPTPAPTQTAAPETAPAAAPESGDKA
jgi:sec-independent protein translocase protein TatA